MSRAAARLLVESGEATFDGAAALPKQRIDAGTEVVVPEQAAARPLEAEPVEFEVRYEDDHVAVVDKPAGVVVHPGAGRQTGTLAAGLLHRWPDLEGVGDENRWGIVHRLDRDTSGLLLVARTAPAHERLRAALRRREVARTYLALAIGKLDIPTGTIDAPLGRDPRHPTRIAVLSEGRPSRTHYRRLAEWHSYGVSLLEVTLESGRTHQIRVHLASIGHPVTGDRTYGGYREDAVGDPGRVWLHATHLAFAHPESGEPVAVDAPLPADLRASLAAMGPPSDGSLPTS